MDNNCIPDRLLTTILKFFHNLGLFKFLFADIWSSKNFGYGQFVDIYVDFGPPLIYKSVFIHILTCWTSICLWHFDGHCAGSSFRFNGVYVCDQKLQKPFSLWRLSAVQRIDSTYGAVYQIEAYRGVMAIMFVMRVVSWVLYCRSDKQYLI